MGCREFLGCCRCVPGLADWILGYYRGDLALSWNFCETPNNLQVLLAPSLARDPTLITSIRYLASGHKHP